MKHFTVLGPLLAALLFFTLCTKQADTASLIGTWEWEGSLCDAAGNCKKEIIADEGSRETFTSDGLYLSRRARSPYRIEGNRIYLGANGREQGDLHAEIVSTGDNVLVLKVGRDKRRYRRVGKAGSTDVD